MTPFVIIACGHQKTRTVEPVPALELYTGGYFQAGLGWALSVTTRPCVYVLSAAHGLIPGSMLVLPYDRRLPYVEDDMGAQAARYFVQQLRNQASQLGLATLEPWFVGGQPYLEYLRQAIPRVRWLTERALTPGRATRGIGAQRMWLQRHHGELPGGTP